MTSKMFYWVWLQTILFKLVFCFNFDTSFPIVYSDPSSNLQRSSYFGYSVILHQQPWIQIGAPKANVTNRKIKEPGGVYRCEIYGPCSYLNVDPYPAPFRDKKDGSWIGGSMDIHEELGRYVVCGYRWINNRYGDYYMEGACYWSHVNDTTPERLLPLIDGGRAVIYDKSANINVFYYAQGEAGFSAHLLQLKTGEAQLLLGAPGVYNWDGTALVYKDGPDESPVASRLVRNKRAPGYADFSDLNVANAITTTQTAAFGLFGYAVTSGYFFNESTVYYVTGAPRSKNLVGQILIYTFANTTEQALEVRDSRQGYQYGEYFGSALTAGDINGDKLDDLIVGAPFYTSGKYNEGRIFIFLGSNKETLETPSSNAIIQGSGIGGQFGSCVMFLGDIDLDGFADVAVGAPYENGGSGVIYIFKGSHSGLMGKYNQRIVGKDFIPNIKGFGISLSRAVDIDQNGYKDLAVGAYKSGHVVLLRSKPVITLHQTMIASTSRLDHNAQEFSVKNCFWFTGASLPAKINITREIYVDDILQRAYFGNSSSTVENILLTEYDIACENVTILFRNNITNRYNPITVSAFPKLILEKDERTVIYADNAQSYSQVDKFCKECPVLNDFQSSKGQTMELSFALGCGSDDVCTTRLEFDAKFIDIGEDDRYILGSTDYLKLVVSITNNGEKAYLTQLLVELPKAVHFRSIPSNCLEQNSTEIIICSMENPIYENKQKLINLDLDMKGIINTEFQNLYFKFTVLTSSVNLNNNIFNKTLIIAREADIALSGKSAQQSYRYSTVMNGMPNFTQTYQVEKFGASPINEVFLTILIPTHIEGRELINFMQLYPPEGYHAGQPINCHSEVKYIVEDKISDIESQYAQKDSKDETEGEKSINDLPFDYSDNSMLTPVKKRSIRQVEDTNDTDATQLDYPSNRTFYINCSNTEVTCSAIHCTIGPFKHKQNVAVVQIKMLFDVSSLSDLLGIKDIVIVSTDGGTFINSNGEFEQTGNRPDNARVSSTFIGETPVNKIELWMFLVAIAVGFLLLLLLVLGLIKAGFFQRTKKKELEALKEAEDSEKPHVPTEMCLLDWQLSRTGSPALDLSYFIFTCTDQELREKHYNNLLKEYYKSFCTNLRELGSDPDVLFPYKILQEHLAKFSVYGLFMTIIVLFMMTSDVDEIPDIHNVKPDVELTEIFKYESKNIEKYNTRIRGVILDYVKLGYEM